MPTGPSFAILNDVATLRKWRNWQTHKLEVLALKGVGVQVPPSAPKSPAAHFSALGLGKLPSMHFLLYAVIVVHVIVCFFLIGVVLLQQGKSADLAGTFGGQGSQTAFGPRAAANLLTRLTSWAAAIFMVTSLSLTILYLRNTSSGSSVLSNIKTSAPAQSGK